MSQSHRQKAEAADLREVQGTDTVHHQTSRKKHPKPKGVAQLQLTSMMDVVFQLLIFFILTANFAIDEGVLPAELPQGTPPVPTKVEEPKPPLKIVLRATGIDGVSIWLEGSNTDMGDNFEELYTRLNSARVSPQNADGIYEADYPIVIKPGLDVQWGYVVRTFNAAVRAKYENVSFAQGG